MKLENSKIIDITSGLWAYNTKIAAGSASFEFSIDDQAFVEIVDTAVTASDNGILTLPRCRFRAIFTGDAVSYLDRVQ